MSQNAIEIRGLKKTYAGSRGTAPKQALNGVDLDIPTGSVFGLLGPNGAGKSTLINILAGLVVKTAGQVTIWGFDQDVNPRQSRASIGVMPQELNLIRSSRRAPHWRCRRGFTACPSHSAAATRSLRWSGWKTRPRPMQGPYRGACGGGCFWP